MLVQSSDDSHGGGGGDRGFDMGRCRPKVLPPIDKQRRGGARARAVGAASRRDGK